MLTVINNTQMSHVVTTRGMDMPIALAWAETIPYQNDFSILMHTPDQFAPYTDMELYTLYNSLEALHGTPTATSRQEFIGKLIAELNNQELTSEPPQDGKRVAPLPTNSENDMNATKKTVSKKATKKTATKKATVKKAAAPKIERVMQNDVLLPKDGSKAGQCWVIADKLAKKAGAPPKRADVVEACVKAGLNKAGASADFQGWRKFHGLVNLPKPPKAPAKPPVKKAAVKKAPAKKKTAAKK